MWNLSLILRELKYGVREDLERIIADLIANIFTNIPNRNICSIMQQDKYKCEIIDLLFVWSSNIFVTSMRKGTGALSGMLERWTL